MRLTPEELYEREECDVNMGNAAEASAAAVAAEIWYRREGKW